MGEAVDLPAATHFGEGNVNAPGPTIDLVAQDDLPATKKPEDDDDWDYPYPTDFKIQERAIDDIRPLKVSMSQRNRWC